MLRECGIKQNNIRLGKENVSKLPRECRIMLRDCVIILRMKQYLLIISNRYTNKSTRKVILAFWLEKGNGNCICPPPRLCSTPPLHQHRASPAPHPHLHQTIQSTSYTFFHHIYYSLFYSLIE